jgi:hypothetical protein
MGARHEQVLRKVTVRWVSRGKVNMLYFFSLR